MTLKVYLHKHYHENMLETLMHGYNGVAYYARECQGLYVWWWPLLTFDYADGKMTQFKLILGPHPWDENP